MSKLISKKPIVVCLCGSTRFRDVFTQKNGELTLQGSIVLSIGTLPVPTEEKKLMLDELHLRKIDMSDMIYVLNVGGYIGPSTQSEINYAESKGKLIMYLEPLQS